MTVITANPIERGRELALARRRIRLIDPATGEYLHMFGRGTTRDATWAWSGFRQQADTLAARARTRGEDWPFVPADADDDAPAFTHPLDRLAR